MCWSNVIVFCVLYITNVTAGNAPSGYGTFNHPEGVYATRKHWRMYAQQTPTPPSVAVPAAGPTAQSAPSSAQPPAPPKAVSCSTLQDKDACLKTPDSNCFWDDGTSLCFKDDCDPVRVDSDANACMDATFNRNQVTCREQTHGFIPCDCLAELFTCINITHPYCWKTLYKGQCCGQKETCSTELEKQCPAGACTNVCVGTPQLPEQATLVLICEYAMHGQTCPVKCDPGYKDKLAECVFPPGKLQAEWRPAECIDKCYDTNGKDICGEFGKCHHSQHAANGTTCWCGKDGAGKQRYGQLCELTEGDPNLCSPVCINGGHCIQGKQGAECSCPNYYTAKDCSIYEGNSCLRHNCSGFGECSIDNADPARTKCECGADHEGHICDHPNRCRALIHTKPVADHQGLCKNDKTKGCEWNDKTNNCEENPSRCNCKNGGVCLAGELKITACACKVGFADSTCSSRVGFEGPVNVTHQILALQPKDQTEQEWAKPEFQCAKVLQPILRACNGETTGTNFVDKGFFASSNVTDDLIGILCAEDGCIDAIQKRKDQITKHCSEGVAIRILKYMLQCSKAPKDPSNPSELKYCFHEFHEYEHKADFVPNLYKDHGLYLENADLDAHCSACNKAILHEYSMLTSLVHSKAKPTEDEAADMESTYLVRMHEGICNKVNGEYCAAKFFHLFYGESRTLVSEYEAYKATGANGGKDWLDEVCTDPCFAVGLAWWSELQPYAPKRKRDRNLPMLFEWDVARKYMCVHDDKGGFCMKTASRKIQLIDPYSVQCDQLRAPGVKEDCCVGTLLDALEERTGLFGKEPLNYRKLCDVDVVKGCPFVTKDVKSKTVVLQIPILYSQLDIQDQAAKDKLLAALVKHLKHDVATELGISEQYILDVKINPGTINAGGTPPAVMLGPNGKPTTTDAMQMTHATIELIGPTQTIVDETHKVFVAKTSGEQPLLLHNTALYLSDNQLSLLVHGVSIIPKPDPPQPPTIVPTAMLPPGRAFGPGANATGNGDEGTPKSSMMWVALIVGMLVLVFLGIGVFLAARHYINQKKKKAVKEKELTEQPSGGYKEGEEFEFMDGESGSFDESQSFTYSSD